MGRPKGHRVSAATRRQMSKSQKARWAAIRELMAKAAEAGELPEALMHPENCEPEKARA